MTNDTLTGRILDHKFRLGPLLGKGAIGRVYRATQLSLEREVAIKVLHPGYADHPEAVARFRQEACAVSRLCHPGIVTVFDWGQDEGGLLYLAIEYLAGRDLFEVLRAEAPIGSNRIARLIEQVARALAHAHGHGVVHRDLKPENLRVLLDPVAPGHCRETIKIYDFGIAHVARTAGATQTGSLLGTPYYMSPEQAKAAPVCPQSDLYACGVIMFALATGRLPFVSDSPFELARMHASVPPPRPRQFEPGIDRHLEELILACLAKRPADRPDSALGLAEELERVAARGAGVGQGQAPLRTRAAARRVGRAFTALSVFAVSALFTLLAFEWVATARPGAARWARPDVESVGIVAPSSRIAAAERSRTTEVADEPAPGSPDRANAPPPLDRLQPKP